MIIAVYAVMHLYRAKRLSRRLTAVRIFFSDWNRTQQELDRYGRNLTSMRSRYQNIKGRLDSLNQSLSFGRGLPREELFTKLSARNDSCPQDDDSAG